MEQMPQRPGRGFTFARLGSLVSVLPLGVWTVNHLWDNLAAFRGAEAWERAVTQHPHPIALGATLVMVLLPLLLHTAWGLFRLRGLRPNNLAYPTYGNLKYLLQRASAVGVLLFIGAHLWLALIRPRLVLGHPETFADISQQMRHHGPTLVVYLLGTLGVAYHLANGLASFAWTWGILTTARARRRFEPVWLGTFVVLLAMSWAAVYALWRAG